MANDDQPLSDMTPDAARRKPRFGVASTLAVALILTACGTDNNDEQAGQTATENPPAASDSGDATEPLSAPLSINNDGTSQWEGHTPRGFAGSGTGLFAGDNLNANFPNGEGIQILLTFALPDDVGTPTTATLVSSALDTRGDVFEALGELEAAPVAYNQFGPELFNIEPTGSAVTCEREGETNLSCDVTEAAQSAVAAGADRVQLRLTLEELSDEDGETDLALFFLTDTNTNEPGIFTLELS